jgi:hypothetical protein
MLEREGEEAIKTSGKCQAKTAHSLSQNRSETVGEFYRFLMVESLPLLEIPRSLSMKNRCSQIPYSHSDCTQQYLPIAHALPQSLPRLHVFGIHSRIRNRFQFCIRIRVRILADLHHGILMHCAAGLSLPEQNGIRRCL